MEPGSNWYESAAQFYTRMVQLDSPDAVTVIEEIRSRCGPHAAMCAAVAVAITKLDVQRNGTPPDIGIYAQLLKGYPEALPLLQQAVEFCMPQWRNPNAKAFLQANDYHASLPGG